MKRIGILTTGILALALGSGCYFSKDGPKFDARLPSHQLVALTNMASVELTNRLNPEWLKASTNYFRLGPGDKLELEVIGDPSTRTITPVGPDGKVYFYLLPGTDVGGLTLEDAKARLEEELHKYQTNQIAIQLRGIDSSRVWILGRVQNAGVYPMSAPMTVLEALSLAGGTSTSSTAGAGEDLADLEHAFIIRNGERVPIDFRALLKEGDMTQNIYLQPDDFIYLPSSVSGEIYVLGAVRAPKAVPKNQRTLIAAIAETGGPIKNAYLDHVAIVRGSLTNPKIATVDYKAIVRGESPDVLLEPRDIVYVPFSPYRYLSRYADLALLTFVRAVAINEGAHAAAPGSLPAVAAISVGK
jgi:polysaccharide export outer membrane protein